MPTPPTAEDQIKAEADRLRIRQAATQLVADERANADPLPPLIRLGEFLAQPDPEIRYRVDQIWPSGGRVMLTAAWKAGKTTMLGGLIRSLADGAPFLGAFETTAAARVVLIDNELDKDTLRRWLRAHGIEHDERVELVPLRGRVGRFDIITDSTRARWAQHIGPADVLVFDCLRPVLDALGLDENSDAGRFLVAFDALLVEAGIREAVVLHHMGHGAERSRGDSRLRDWPDAEWRIVRERSNDHADAEPNARRYFSAYGRDVDIPEGLLDYDPQTRALTLAGGSRADTRDEAALDTILALLNENPDGLSGRQIEAELHNSEHPQRAIRAALTKARTKGYTRILPGARRAKIHHLTPEGATRSASVRSSASEVRQRSQSECVSASIEDALHTLTDQPPEVSQ